MRIKIRKKTQQQIFPSRNKTKEEIYIMKKNYTLFFTKGVRKIELKPSSVRAMKASCSEPSK